MKKAAAELRHEGAGDPIASDKILGFSKMVAGSWFISLKFIEPGSNSNSNGNAGWRKEGSGDI